MAWEVGGRRGIRVWGMDARRDKLYTERRISAIQRGLLEVRSTKVARHFNWRVSHEQDALPEERGAVQWEDQWAEFINKFGRG
jgi:hypothetical protein